MAACGSMAGFDSLLPGLILTLISPEANLFVIDAAP